MIYMDNAATTMQKPKEVGEAICQALFTIGNAGRGAADGALSASRIIYETREKLAVLLEPRVRHALHLQQILQKV